MLLKIIRLLMKLAGIKTIPFSEIVVTDDEDGVIAVVSPEEIIEHDGYHVIAH